MRSEDLIPALGLLIPIVTVTVSLLALIIWIVVAHRRRMHEVDCRHKERMAAIDKGLELPPESTPPQPEQIQPRSRYLLRGLIWLGVGWKVHHINVWQRSISFVRVSQDETTDSP